jgi:hypothetical protein
MPISGFMPAIMKVSRAGTQSNSSPQPPKEQRDL